MKHKLYSGQSKLTARKETIQAPYQYHLGERLQKDKQYWTLAGAVSEDGEEINQDCELYQLERAGLFKRSQFFGVDRNPEIIKINKSLIPDTNWIAGSFCEVMSRAHRDGNFNPAVVNLDHVRMAEGAAKDFVDIFVLLNRANISNVMLTVNFMTKNPRAGLRCSFKDFEEAVFRRPIMYNYIDSWGKAIKPYKYEGAGNRGIKEFTSFSLIKKS